MACSALQLISTQRADHRRHAQVLIIVLVGADQRDGRHADVAARAGLVVVRRGLGDRLGLLDVVHHGFFAPLVVDALPAAPQGFPIKIYSDLGWLRRLVAACRPHEQIGGGCEKSSKGLLKERVAKKPTRPVCLRTVSVALCPTQTSPGSVSRGGRGPGASSAALSMPRPRTGNGTKHSRDHPS